MSIIRMPPRQAKVVALRREDRFPDYTDHSHSQNGALALLVATAIVAGCVTGLLAYDAKRPLAMGAANAPVQSLAISVEPMSAATIR